MSFLQDEFYLEKEANDFFLRAYNSLPKDLSIRESKKQIYTVIENINSFDLEEKNILEIGCFIGDLLWYFKSRHNSSVFGIEPSSLACEYSKKNYDLELFNGTFRNSEFFSFEEDNFSKFDLIIADDVLSWMARSHILQVVSAIDWILKPGGILFLRDFNPYFGFAYKNHHVKNAEVFNFKSMSGHKQFFLNTGMYLNEYEYSRVDSTYQKKSTSRPDSCVWSDVLLRKLEKPLHPILSMDNN